MLREITWTEYLEWVEFGQLEPFDEERMDTRFAALRATVANTVRDRKKRPRPYTAHDYQLAFGDTPVTRSQATDWRYMKSLGKLMASESKKPPKPKPVRKTPARKPNVR